MVFVFSDLPKKCNSACKRSSYLFSAFCLLIPLALAGCASKETALEIPQKVEIKQNIIHSSGYANADIQGEDFTLKEEEILLTTGELDADLTKDQMEEVTVYYKHFLYEKREMLERFLARSQPYLEYTKDVFKTRNMPEELAYLAFVESGYNVQAQSPSGASGIWQFMPATGRRYGLHQDWWGDWRHDPYLATEAAAEYLSFLYNKFGDWHLAISAYNAGEGKIKRALEGTSTTDLFALLQANEELDSKTQIRNETIEYLPRFIAMTKIMRNADALGLIPLPQGEVFPKQDITSIPVDVSTDLLAVANAIDMEWSEFKAYNPALARYVSPADRMINIYVPSDKKVQTHAALAQKQSPQGWRMYSAKSGDTFKKVSKLSGVPVSILRSTNKLKEPFTAGTTIRIPSMPGAKAIPQQLQTMVAENKNKEQAKPIAKTVKAETSKTVVQAKQVAGSHIVVNGDTLYSIARRYEVTVDAILAANKGVTPSNLQLGQKLVLPKQGSAVASNAQTQKTQKTAKYTVQAGDTVWAIARKFDTDPKEILKLNNLNENPLLKPGDTVLVALKS